MHHIIGGGPPPQARRLAKPGDMVVSVSLSILSGKSDTSLEILL
jgi:hypothetical protein